MTRRAGVTVAGLLAAAMVAAAVPVAAASDVVPRGGKYAGTEAYKTTPLPVSLTVARNGKRVTSFTGQAQVQDGCDNHIVTFQAPQGPMRIDAGGAFSQTSTNYSQDGVKVRVAGTFVSKVKARGHIAVRIAHHKQCTAKRPFVVRRQPATAS